MEATIEGCRASATESDVVFLDSAAFQVLSPSMPKISQRHINKEQEDEADYDEIVASTRRTFRTRFILSDDEEQHVATKSKDVNNGKERTDTK